MTAISKFGEGLTFGSTVSGADHLFWARGLLGVASCAFAAWPLAENFLNLPEDQDGQAWLGVDIGFHSPFPYTGRELYLDNCPHYENKPCFYTGSSMRAANAVAYWLSRGRSDNAMAVILSYEYSRLFRYAWR